VSDDLAALWPLEPGVVLLDHGSFGACPIGVLRHQEHDERLAGALGKELRG
jgi:hypothetical protein